MASGLLPWARVCTYDREFRTTWRRSDGKRIPLAIRRTNLSGGEDASGSLADRM